MAGVLKKTTGLAGLAVSSHPHKTLGILYSKLLQVLQKMPEDAAYRRHTEALTQARLGVVKSEPNIQRMESKIDGGMAEELILQAERELSLSRRMLEWRPWEPLTEQAPTNQWKWPPT